jgi:hypothetical protein
MVLYDHDVAHVVVGVESTSCVGHYDDLYTQQLHHTNRHRQLYNIEYSETEIKGVQQEIL